MTSRHSPRAGTTAVRNQKKQTKKQPLRMLHHLSGVWEEIIRKINTLHSYIRK